MNHTSTFRWFAVAILAAALLLALVGSTLEAAVLVEDHFDDGNYTKNPMWTTTSTNLCQVTDGELEMPPGSRLSLRFAMAPRTPLTISLRLRKEAVSSGHGFMISIANSSLEGYSVTGADYPAAYGGTEAANCSGFAYGNYGLITAQGTPGQSLNQNTTFQTLVLTFDPITQQVTLTKDDTIVVSFQGVPSVEGGDLESVDRLDLWLPYSAGGPAQLADDVVVTETAPSAKKQSDVIRK